MIIENFNNLLEEIQKEEELEEARKAASILDKLKKISDQHQGKYLVLPDGNKVMVDAGTAGLLVQMHGMLNDKNKKMFNDKIQTLDGFERINTLAWKNAKFK